MDIFIDIDLIFEIRYMLLGLARCTKFLEESVLQELYYKSIEENLATLQIPVTPVISNYIQTIRYKITGYHLIKSHSSQNITLIGTIEPNYYSLILESNQQKYIPQISPVDLIETVNSSDKVKVITSDTRFYQLLIQLGIPVDLIPLKIRNFEDEIGSTAKEVIGTALSVPWSGHYTLERPVSISGNIISGFGRGSTELGFPTANIDFKEELDAVPGLYAGTAEVNGVVYKAAISIGWCPFYDNKKISYEVYILHHFHANLVGVHIICRLLHYIRPEAAFNSIDELKFAIGLDVALTQKLVPK
jgi:riboflavin kinase